MDDKAKKEFVNLEAAKFHDDGGVYLDLVRRIQNDGVCPFCPGNLEKYHTKPILKEGEYWIMTDNASPYKHAKHHILFIHKKHIENVVDLSDEASQELLEIVRAEAKKRNIQGGTFYMRFGNTAYTGASVSHLHANLISPDTDNLNREPILARVG